MSLSLLALLSVAGGLGAVARYALDCLLSPVSSGAVPRSTMLINLSGSLALGFCIGAAAAHALSPAALVIVGTGFLGGYTTFSSTAVATVELLRDRRWAQAAMNGPGMLVASTALAGAGMAAGSALGS